MQATGTRVQYQVENGEDCVIEQFLGDWHTLNQKFLDPNEVINLIGDAGKILKIDPLQVMNASVKFSMRASAKMASRAALAQNFPLVLQTLMNPGLIQQLQATGKTINFVELEQMLFDMLVHQPVTNLFRDMTPQEQQKMDQPPPTDRLHLQMQQERLAAQHDGNEDKQLADLVRTLLKGIIDQGGAHAEMGQQAAHDLQHLLIGKSMDGMNMLAAKPEPSESTGG